MNGGTLHQSAIPEKTAGNASLSQIVAVSRVAKDGGETDLDMNTISGSPGMDYDALLCIDALRKNLLARARTIYDLGDIFELMLSSGTISDTMPVFGAYRQFLLVCTQRAQMFYAYTAEELARYLPWVIRRFLEAPRTVNSFFPYMLVALKVIKRGMDAMKADKDEKDLWDRSAPNQAGAKKRGGKKVKGGQMVASRGGYSSP